MCGWLLVWTVDLINEALDLVLHFRKELGVIYLPRLMKFKLSRDLKVEHFKLPRFGNGWKQAVLPEVD